ncbi:head-tail adaptor protein [Jannaschia sp. LMIT008]|uniref:head-tail adaptor protein n=1 Tax=Jannaschia maritima TaxID=3032585 RepID=UPI0028117483|nr:head-tail adaptor protein [Jannaschia sp. LMIT008]
MRRTLTRRLVRLVPDHVGDGAGGLSRTWVEVGALWGDVQARSGSLRVTELGADPRLKVRIVIHGVPDDHPSRPRQGDRLRDGGRLFEVEAVHAIDHRGRYLGCFAHEVSEREGGDVL